MEIHLSQVFKRVTKKYMMLRSKMTFDPVFGIFGIFYDLIYPLIDPKVPFCSYKIWSKLPFLMDLEKGRKWALRLLVSQKLYNTTIK